MRDYMNSLSMSNKGTLLDLRVKIVEEFKNHIHHKLLIELTPALSTEANAFCYYTGGHFVYMVKSSRIIHTLDRQLKNSLIEKGYANDPNK
jgi:hypothetical protein